MTAITRRSTFLLTALVSTLLAACDGKSSRMTEPPACTIESALASRSPAPAVVPEASPYDTEFAAAGAEFGIPASLLRAIGYVETRWQMVEGQEEFPGVPPAFGVMALRGERLKEGARLAGVSETAARGDARANIRAAAALIRAYGDSLRISSLDSGSWSPALARYSGIELADARESWLRDVHAVRAGRRAMPMRPSLGMSSSGTCDPTDPPPAPLVDQVGAIWRPSYNFNTRMSGDGGRIQLVIIHSCEGNYAGCWSWLANPQSQVSAHYVVREDGAEITQLVREAGRAWHIGATYDSALNAGHGGHLHGIQSNHFTIGIEHAGYASQTTWPAAQLDVSAKLVCDAAKRWGIPRNRLHIVAHGQLQPWNRTDPGSNWPWAEYMARIEQHCAGALGSAAPQSHRPLHVHIVAETPLTRAAQTFTQCAWRSST